MAEIQDLLATDASNIARWPENMPFSGVNDAGRADEGILARWYKDSDGSITASGSSNAFSITSNRTIAAYFNNLVMLFTANFSITGAATLNLNGLGAKAIKRPNGDALLTGDIVSSQPVHVIYKSGTDQWYLLAAVYATTIATPTPSAEVRTASATLTIPTSATKLLIRLVAGGGGGGGGSGTSIGGAGGAGAGLIKYLTGLTGGNTLALTIGTAGTGGTAGANNGTAGGASILASGTQTISTLTANGGGAGNGASSSFGAAGAGGTATGGDANITGQGGSTTAAHSQGGQACFGFGATAIQGDTASAGAAAPGYGAGGNGAYCTGSSLAGGNGSAGIALLQWYA